MRRVRMFTKLPVSPTFVRTIQPRVNGKFGKAQKVVVDNPKYFHGSMDGVVCPAGAHAGTNWRGMKGHKRPSENGNTYVGRQRSGRILRNFSELGKRARTQFRAMCFANANARAQEIAIRRLPTATTGEDRTLGQGAMLEMTKWMMEALR